jgi:hypothetical protein
MLTYIDVGCLDWDFENCDRQVRLPDRNADLCGYIKVGPTSSPPTHRSGGVRIVLDMYGREVIFAVA